MNRSLTSWLLGGALCASLGWNWRLARADAPAPAAAACTTLDAAPLALAPEQERALDALCQESCRSADRLATRADERERELLGALASGALDEAGAEARVAEVAELRRASLAACVEGILAVRAVLTPEQVGRLLQQCPPGGECR